MKATYAWTVASALVFAFAAGDAGAQRTAAGEHWVGTWATAVASSNDGLPPLRRPFPAGARGRGGQGVAAVAAVHDQTLRQIVHTSIGGSRFRVVFSNAFGTEPLTIGAAYIALRAQDSAIVARAGKPLLFGGKTSITLPAGAPALSDPVDFAAPPFADVAIDVYVPSDTTASPLTQHTQGPQVSYLSEAGNHAGKEQFPVARTVTSWYFLSQLEVVAPASVSAVVTLGDSITDGVASTANMNRRWPDELARRLASSQMAVLNLGLAGNRLRTNQTGTNALARFDRDVTPQSGVTHVIVLEGINDIGFAYDDPTPTVDDLISAHQQLIARAHARGLKIIGATLTPFGGAFYATPEGEAKRQAFNTWIRTSGAYDGVIDFDRAVRDPSQPTRTLSTFDPGDHLHLNDIGYRTLADAIDLGLLKAGAFRRQAH